MFDKLYELKKKGYSPDAILDIGAHHGLWTISMKTIYPDPNYYLFEAINYNELNDMKHHRNVSVYNVLLNDKPEIVNWYEMRNTGDSMFIEKTKYFVDCPIIKRE